MQHKPGSQNTNADGLFRCLQENGVKEESFMQVCVVGKEGDRELDSEEESEEGNDGVV